MLCCIQAVECIDVRMRLWIQTKDCLYFPNSNRMCTIGYVRKYLVGNSKFRFTACHRIFKTKLLERISSVIDISIYRITSKDKISGCRCLKPLIIKIRTHAVLPDGFEQICYSEFATLGEYTSRSRMLCTDFIGFVPRGMKVQLVVESNLSTAVIL